jgi:hypothetical protein
LTTVKKVSRRGLLAAAIMLPLILGFYSLANAATQTVPLSCDKDNINDHIDDIDATINADPKDTPTDFVLEDGCTFVASATIVPSNGDEVTCAVAPTFDPGNKITGGNYTGSTGTGAAIAEGSMSDASYHYGIEVMNNEAAGILSAKGTFDRVELTNNTLNSNALGIIGSGMKARDEVEVKNSYVHDTQGNGIWCDNSCADSPIATHPNGFYVHDNLVVNNRRAGIRFENVGSSGGQALIELNELHGNSPDEKRGAISVRDAQNATIQNNIFGANARNVAIVASDSGRSSRPDLYNIDIWNNTLNGDIIKGCDLPDSIVDCTP